jgi:Domain of unknown function (DUF3127)
MALELEGKVVVLLAEQSGTGASSGKAWRKQSFVLETEEQYPKKVVFDAWNDTVDAIKQLQVGEKLKVHFRAESREYNEKWYTNLTAWRITKISEQTISGGGSNPPVEPPADVLYENDNKQAPPVDLKKDDAEDDLPF